MRWREHDDCPPETGHYICEVIQRPNDPGSKGDTTTKLAYVKCLIETNDAYWTDAPKGFKVLRWLDEESKDYAEKDVLEMIMDASDGQYSLEGAKNVLNLYKPV